MALIAFTSRRWLVDGAGVVAIPWRALKMLLLRIDARLRRPTTVQRAALGLSLYLLLATNWPLWLALTRLGLGTGVWLRSLAGMAILLLCATLALLTLTACKHVTRWAWWLLALIAALAQYYMLTYGVVIDPAMAANVLQTDANEAADLLGWRVAGALIFVLLPPSWWLLRLRLLPTPWRRQLLRNLLLLAGALVLAIGTLATLSRTLLPLMRNHPQLRYLMNPAASVYSAGVALGRQWRSAAQVRTLTPITAGAGLGTSYAQAAARPLVFVLVVGETARADHFGINGYARDTTEQLARRDALSWRSVRSCGTSTQASLPCMFSHLGKKAFDARTSEYENLLDVVRAAGLAVLWIDNQSGCKGVCDRVESAQASAGLDPEQRARLCPQGECPDTVMLEGLDGRIAALPRALREHGVLLVLHQMGSHGPAYYKRSLASQKRFFPECRTEVLADCAQAALVNAYDNSIAATDDFLGQTIDWLQARQARYDTGLIYLSDHGESLGEYGLFLHGMPYAIAPEAQKHVPMVAWLSPQLQRRDGLSERCLRAGLQAPLTHDALFHTLLGTLDLRSPTYVKAQDAWAHCRYRP